MNKRKAAEWVAAMVWMKKYPDAPAVLKQVTQEKYSAAMKGAVPYKAGINFSMLPKKERPKPYKRLLKDAWAAYSEYIRKRDTFDGENCKCCTCPEVDNWLYMQAGHYQSTIYESTKFDDENVHAQCPSCNMPPNNGRPEEYAAFLDDRYGKGTAARIKARAHRRPLLRKELEDIIKKYGACST